ncbi:MAG: hypothetical protein FWE35_12095 [Streptosporangiales bacterium]|nr:hypothetical protein [Streptosporangiales bacterium]
MEEQAAHLAELERWVGDQCLDTDGMTGLLSPMTSLVPRVAQPVTAKLGESQRGMHDVPGTITLGGDGSYPAPLPRFPDIKSLHLPQVGGFADEPVKLASPGGAEEDAHKNMRDNLLALQASLGNGPLGVAEKAFRVCTGQDLIALLVHPLLGEYGRLKYLHEAYDELAAGTYTVAATVRKGSWALADEWTGDAAVGFSSYMFRWGMGIGGIGDAATVISKAYRDAYEAVMPLLDTALIAINDLAKKELRELAALAAGDAATMLFGGPANLVADLVALVNTAYRVYETIRLVILGTHSIQKIFHEISKVIRDVHTAVDKVIHYASQPVQSVRELIDHLEERGFEFEKNAVWVPALGVARITMLPSSSSEAGPGAEAPSDDRDENPDSAPVDDQSPEHHRIASRIYDHLKAGGEVSEVRDLIADLTRTLSGHARAGDEPAPAVSGA